MSELQRFLPDDQELMAGVLFRIGCWMSGVDDTDVGEASEEVERARLVAVLEQISKEVWSTALVNEIAAEALRRRDSWPRWERTSDGVIGDVTEVRQILKAQATDDEYATFCKAAIMVATSVARAFREEPDNMPGHDGFFDWLADRADHLILTISDPQAAKDKNISPAEDDALGDLIEALKG